MVVYIIVPSIYSVMPSVGITVTGFAIMISWFTDMVTDPVLGIYLDKLVLNIGWKV
jgi:Na+/melibiose symporter-like transporter